MLKSKKTQSQNPSFSSTLLDDIYNSIDATNPKSQHQFFPDQANHKQSTRTRSVTDRKSRRDHRFFFGSVSSSSDSNSSSIFSSSDTELTHAKKTSSRPLCFGPSRTKPRKTEDKSALFHENRAYRVMDYSSDTTKGTRREEIWGNQRTKSTKRSENLKKPKTPVSPGGRIVNFLNSLFSNNSKKTMASKNNPRTTSYEDDDDGGGFVRKPRGYCNHDASTCSSASSFSRSCTNRGSEKSSSDGVKRSVRFSPVDFIVSEKNSSSRSFVGKTSMYADEEELYYDRNRNGTRLLMSSSLPGGWKMEKEGEEGERRSVEGIGRDFLNQSRSRIERGVGNRVFEEDYYDEDASDSSSDLFELDLVGNIDRFRDELPVYQTTCAAFIL